MPGPRPAARSIDPRVLDALLALLLFAAALAWFWLTLDRTFHLTDEGYLLHMGQRVARGEWPHRDFVEVYGPGVFTAVGAIWQLGDGELLFVRRAVATWKALAVVLGFFMTRRLAPPAVAVGVGLISIVFWGRASENVNTPHAALWTVPLCMAATLAVMSALDVRPHPRPEPRRVLGLAVAGAIGGIAVLFKQSLGMAAGFGLGLALIAVSMSGLDPTRDPAAPAAHSRQGRRLRAGLLAFWALLALVPLAPGFAHLTPAAYAIHLFPIHALMACAAIALLRRPRVPRPWPLVRNRLLPLAVGAAVPLGLVALLYLRGGHLDELVLGMFERPLRLRNYAIATPIPPPSISVFVAGAGCMLAAAWMHLGARRRWAWPLGLCGLALMAVAATSIPHSNPRLYTPGVLARSATAFDWVLHPVILLGAVAIFGPHWLARRPDGDGMEEETDERRLRQVWPLAFFSALLCFQVFPRGAHNVWLVQAAWMPLLGVALFEIARRLAPAAPPLRRFALAAAMAAIPLWLAWPVAADSWQLHASPHRSLALRHTRGLEIGRASIARSKLDDVEALVAQLDAQPAGPLLLIGGDVMLYTLSDRPPLRPDYDFPLYGVALDMLPLRELSALDDGGWARALEAEPGAIVVVARDPAGRRVLDALPSLKAHLARHYSVTRRYGRYQLMSAETPPAPGSEPAERRTPR